MALSVKAYINPDTNQQEIRRFAIDEGASANYGYLRQKIEQVFPSVRGKAFKLFWKDSDNEMITFSSDEELVEALGSIEGEVFRVYVKGDDQNATFVGEAGETADAEQEGEAHPGVVCDSCDKHIFGIRFKCVVCPNYDLCMTCETKGMHKEHEMLRIATPRTPENHWFHGFNPFAFGHPPPHHPPHGPPPHHPPHGFPAHAFSDFGRGFGPWGRGCGRRAGRGGGGRGRCPKGKRCNNGGKKCDRHATAEAAAEGSPGEVPVGPPFLHAVGESIASFLGPFGVEVHTYASSEPDCCQGKCQEDEGTGSAEASAQAGPSGESTGPPASDDMEESAPEASTEGTSEMDVQPPEEFVLVDDKPGDEQDGASGTVEDEEPTDPLEVAIAKMRAMGFEDDSGWLKQLITAKGYDLNKVLDAMQFEGKN